MDFTKFASLLDKRALFFARADKLGDPFEGSLSEVNAKLQPVLHKDVPETIRTGLRNFRQRLRGFTFVSCWHQSLHESAAMWRLYSREHDGIAIKTDFQAFTQSLAGDEVVYVGQMHYVDFDTTFIPENNAFAPYLYKRKSFEHEREVRAVCAKLPEQEQGKPYLSGDTVQVGVYLAVDLSCLIHEVVIAPYAEDWFIDLVTSITSRYGVQTAVRPSTLATPPTWG